LQQLLSAHREMTMKKIVVLASLALALAAGTVTVMTVRPHSAVADGGGCSSC
jgi:hypothetical protein